LERNSPSPVNGKDEGESSEEEDNQQESRLKRKHDKLDEDEKQMKKQIRLLSMANLTKINQNADVPRTPEQIKNEKITITSRISSSSS